MSARNVATSSRTATPAQGWTGPEEAATAALVLEESVRRHRPQWYVELHIEVALAIVAVAVVGFLTQASLAVVVLVGATSIAARYWPGGPRDRAGSVRFDRIFRDCASPLCVAALAGAAGWWTRPEMVSALAVAAAGLSVALAGGLVRTYRPTVQRVLVVGSPVSVAEATTRWADSSLVRIVGTKVIDAEHPRVPHPRTGLLPNVSDAYKVIDREDLVRCDPDMVVVVPGPEIDAECIRRIGWALEGTRTALAVQSSLDGIASHRIEHTSFAGASLVQLSSSRPALTRVLLKGLGDRAIGGLLLLLLAPLLGVLVMAVRLTSTGPAIFRQVRVGQDGSLFTMYKLRTMVTSAEDDKAALLESNEVSGPLFKKKADPRITRFGGVLRKYSLDELPQLFNVIKGDMSLVGPRPALPEEVAQYNSLERRRLAAKPGLTGLWQVSGRSDLSWDDAVRLDNHYTENWRITDDVVILARTVNAVIGSRGAY
ncbi:exopolysaccharide biosynthesis polyprenyl glycosylphosphotransferase [Nocardioides gilvus]|uniref:exopolysaccharide biosynthesis polyprenyl glycosylphosphotransferase n=1 Tax=Nocardioides gilvus TaxID=1735589 RepID=UPI00194F3738|nr:exopolysaccharide biosynthesis polyprenyl glycosylphosphotransferase [Nocardioides gilvus]